MKFKYRKWVLKCSMVHASRQWMKQVRLKRYHNISLYRFFSIFIHHIRKNDLLDRANGVAYNFILAIFPAIIFLFTLLPYISRWFPVVNKHSIMEFIQGMLPPTMQEAISSTVFDIVDNQRGGLLTFGFLFALFLSTNGTMALMRVFNACYHTVERRSMIRMRITALGLTLMLAGSTIIAVLLLVVGQVAVNFLTENIYAFSNLDLAPYTVYFILALRFIVVFIVLFVTISFIYYFGPSIHYNWRFFSVGSLVATLGTLLTSHGFSYYISHFGAYNKVYGSIGVLIALIVLVQLITVVLLLGYEINASLHQGMRTSKVLPKKPVDVKKKRGSTYDRSGHGKALSNLQ